MWNLWLIAVLISIAVVSVLLIVISILEDNANRRHVKRDRSDHDRE